MERTDSSVGVRIEYDETEEGEHFAYIALSPFLFAEQIIPAISFDQQTCCFWPARFRRK